MKVRLLFSPRRWWDFLVHPAAFPDGHFYSPIVDPSQLSARAGGLWPDEAPPTPGIEWDETGHRRLLDDMEPFAAGYDDPETPAGITRFHDPNGFYQGLDSRMLFGNHYASRVLPDAVESCWGRSCGGAGIRLRAV